MPELEAGGAPAPAPEAPAPIDTSPPAVGAPPVESAPPTIDETLEAAWDKLQTSNERGTDGKFVSKDKPAVEPAAETKSADQPLTETTEPAPSTPAIDPPQSWSAEARAHWAKLPPETQKYIAQREGEAHKAITSNGDRIKSFEPVERVITQNRDSWARRGLQPDQAIAVLVDAQNQLDRNPIDGLINIGLSYGFDLRPLLSGQQGSLPAPDPRVGQVEQRLNQLQQNVQQQLTQQAEQQSAADAALVQEFAKGKPHFEDVRKLMASFLKDGHAENLQSAYDMAVNAAPDIRQRIQEDQRKADEVKRKADEAKRLEDLKAKASDAAKSAKLNVKSGTAHPNPKTIDDTLEETWRRING